MERPEIIRTQNRREQLVRVVALGTFFMLDANLTGLTERPAIARAAGRWSGLVRSTCPALSSLLSGVAHCGTRIVRGRMLVGEREQGCGEGVAGPPSLTLVGHDASWLRWLSGRMRPCEMLEVPQERRKGHLIRAANAYLRLISASCEGCPLIMRPFVVRATIHSSPGGFYEVRAAGLSSAR